MVLIDMDNTLADLAGTWLHRWGTASSSPLSLSAIRSYRIPRCVPKEAAHHFAATIQDPEFFRTLPPLPGAIEAVSTWLDIGIPCRIVTDAPSEAIAQAKAEWLNQYFPDRRLAATMVNTAEKWRIEGAVLIDDAPQNLWAYHRHHRQASLATLVWPYTPPSLPPGTLRALDWSALDRWIFRVFSDRLY